MNDFYPKWLAKLLSYISAFVCGAYTHAAFNGNPPETTRIIITISFGVMFYIMSLPDKKDQ